MTITIPLPYKVSLNKIYGGIHYRTRSRYKDDFVNAVWYERLKPYTGAFPVHITYEFQYKGKRLDSLNAAFMAKMIEDGLVHCGVLPDDSPKYVAGSTLLVGTGDNKVVINIQSTGGLQ